VDPDLDHLSERKDARYLRDFASDGCVEASGIRATESGDNSLCPRSAVATITNKTVTPSVAKMYSSAVCSR
jgi:hypothetical protein